jgi:hypothetical protein
LSAFEPNNDERDPRQECFPASPSSPETTKDDRAKQKNNQSGSSQEEPFPLSVPDFVLGVREFFREIKRFLMFVRHSKNTNAALVVLTLCLVIFTLLQAVFVSLQIGPLKQSANTAARQLEMQDRPWLKEEVKSAFDFRPQNGAIGWAVTIKANNVGHSVATDVFPDARLIAIQDADLIDGPRRQVTQLCRDMIKRSENMKAHDPDLWNNSIFPDDSHRFIPFNVTLWPTDIAGKSFDGGVTLGKSVFPVLIGCIEYHYPTSGKAHHTGFVYVLSHNDDAALQESTRVFFSIEKTVPKDNVVLTKSAQMAD